MRRKRKLAEEKDYKKKKIKDRIIAEDGRRGNGTWNIF